MIVTRRIALRMALIVLAGVILQISFFSYLSFFGATPDVVAVLVASLGLLGGGVVGAVSGFAAGVLLDSALLQTLGVSSLALLVAGYVAGRYREGFDVSSRVRRALVIGGVTLLATAIFSALQIMLGVSTPVSLLVVREILVKGILGGLLAVGVFPLTRRLLRAALIDDERPGSIRARPAIAARASSRGRARRPRVRSLSGAGGGGSF